MLWAADRVIFKVQYSYIKFIFICTLVFFSGHPESSAAYIVFSVLYAVIFTLLTRQKILIVIITVIICGIFSVLLAAFLILPFLYTELQLPSHVTSNVSWQPENENILGIILPFLSTGVLPLIFSAVQFSPAYLSLFVGPAGPAGLTHDAPAPHRATTNTLSILALLCIILMAVVRPWGLKPGLIYFNSCYSFGVLLIFIAYKVALFADYHEHRPQIVTSSVVVPQLSAYLYGFYLFIFASMAVLLQYNSRAFDTFLTVLFLSFSNADASAAPNWILVIISVLTMAFTMIYSLMTRRSVSPSRVSRLIMELVLLLHVTVEVVTYSHLNPMMPRSEPDFSYLLDHSSTITSNRMPSLLMGNSSSIWNLSLTQLSTVFHTCRYRTFMMFLNSNNYTFECTPLRESNNNLVELPETTNQRLSTGLFRTLSFSQQDGRLRTIQPEHVISGLYTEAYECAPRTRASLDGLAQSIVQNQRILYIENTLNDIFWSHDAAISHCSARRTADPIYDDPTLSLTTSFINRIADIMRYKLSSRVSVDITDMQNQWLVTAIRAQDGWTALIDGHRHSLYTGQFMFLTAYVPSGSKLLELFYCPPLALPGGLISTVFGCILTIFHFSRFRDSLLMHRISPFLWTALFIMLYWLCIMMYIF